MPQIEGDLIRVGVVGLGNMGKHHVRVLSEIPTVELVAVADPSESARYEIERSRRLTTHESMEAMLEAESLDAVTLAIPTSQHEASALLAIDAGVPFLIEKPLSGTVESARTIVNAATKAGVFGTVGHVERYNPAVQAVKRGVLAGELGRVFQLRAIRTGPLPTRIQDVGVVVDLATHDLDVIRNIVDQPVERVFAETARRMHSEHEDLSTSLLRFTDGTIALLDVNWLTPVKIRELTVVGENGMYRLDYVSQDLYFYENSHTQYWSDFTGRQGVSEGNMVRYRIDRAEPLRRELEAFANAVAGKEVDLVSLEDGLLAVALAEALKESARENRAVRNGQLLHPPLASRLSN